MEILFIIITLLAIFIGTPLLLLSLPSTKGWAGEKLVAHKLKAIFPSVGTRFFASARLALTSKYFGIIEYLVNLIPILTTAN